jgi:hypothetical protein
LAHRVLAGLAGTSSWEKPVNVTLAASAVAGGMLAALLAAGCAAQGAGPPGGTVPACTSYGVRAIEHDVTVTRMPAACEGLSKAQVNLAVGRAIFAVAGGRSKVAWRREAYLVGARLAYLASGPQDTAGPQPSGTAVPGSGAPARRGSDAALGFAALGAWLLTAGSGSYMLGAWISRSGIGRLLTGGPRLQPAVISGHFALAAAGLLVWIAYLATDEAALAWTAVGLLPLVAGLGMALLALGSSGERRGPVAAAGPRAAPGAPARRRGPILVVIGHGLLAAGTVLLVLLAALGAQGG